MKVITLVVEGGRYLGKTHGFELHLLLHQMVAFKKISDNRENIEIAGSYMKKLFLQLDFQCIKKLLKNLGEEVFQNHITLHLIQI